jgi:transcriptional regulator with XRE-family HTH domain
MNAKKASNSTDRYVGSRVRMRRLMLGMSQTDLANGLDLTFQQIQKYEKGTNRVGASRLQQMANLLQVPVAFFFEGGPSVASAKANAKAAPDYVSEFLATSEGLALISGFMKIGSPKLRRSIVELVDQLAQRGKK